MKKNIYSMFFFIFFICCLLTLFYLNPSPLSITNSLNSLYSSNENKMMVNSIYDVNFVISKDNPLKSKIFIPIFNVNNIEDARYFSDIFNIKDNFDETEEYFSFSDVKGELQIFKYNNLVKFKNNLLNYLDGNIKTEEEIIKIAEKFIGDTLLIINYEEIAVTLMDDVYNVKFIDRLDSYKNHSFNTNVTIDKFGSILSLDYFYVEFDKINSTNLKTMQKAYLELPIDFDDDIKVSLNNCSLVYIYENSIVQPAYHFVGETINGERFESYVKASVYN